MIRNFIQWFRDWIQWEPTEPLGLSEGQTNYWLVSRHTSSVEVLWRGDTYVENRSGWMLR